MTATLPLSPAPVTCPNASRPACTNDIPDCIALVEDWMARCQWIPRSVTRPFVKRRVTFSILAGHMRVLTDPEPNGAVAAFLSLDAENAQVRAVFSRTRGSALGQKLLNEAKQDRDFLWFKTPFMDPLIQSFFRREGFVPIGGKSPMSDYPVAGLRMEWWRPQ
ncbi:hypothetical protein J4E08_15690 [Sagittula sp. NFXS13]|uniref:hypothetical protein n=1 Tax=Sagittula sp. NFXS13 TaxID=2819095 RepID=UPI0032DFB666